MRRDNCSSNAPEFDLYLASSSPRRRELLQQIGVLLQILPVAVSEQVVAGESPVEHVSRLALEKAMAGRDKASADPGGALLPVLGSDTVVVCDERILGKPRDQEEAITMLLSLSGRSHRVLTAVAVVQGHKQKLLYNDTEVWFRNISRAEAQKYWETGEPADKAGGYGIQGLGAVFVQKLAGSYSGVVGLPLAETAELLADFGVPVWRVRQQSIGYETGSDKQRVES